MWGHSSRSLKALPAFLIGVVIQGVHGRCAWPHEDCSHTGCCEIKGHKCFKKNEWWASCMKRCHKGIHHDDHGSHRTPWSCHRVDKNHKDCAAKHVDCAHLGCCKDPGHKCYRKNVHWASCRTSCSKGEIHHGDPVEHRTPWSCELIQTHEDADDGNEWEEDRGRSDKEEAEEIDDELHNSHGEDLSQNWGGGLQATHFWDCNGGGCDACELRPWNVREYKYAPHYAPTDPSKHGGALYGEKLWLTGAASDALTRLMGPDTDCCGADGDGGGGCGQCLLIKTGESDHPDWLAVIMKKNRCPPWSNGCDKVHMDVAVPGFDNLQYSTANVCGDGQRSDTYIQKHHSAICGSVAPKHCNCWQLPGDTAEQRQIRDGCLLFKSWGWHRGTPKLDYRPVPCPQNFINWVRIGKAFNERGVISLSETWNTSSAAAPETAVAPPPPPGPRARLASLAERGTAAGGVALLGLAAAAAWRRSGRRRAKELLLRAEEGSAEAEE